jgi:hypothetical protein
MINGKQPQYRTILALNPTDEDHWIPQIFLHEKPKDHEIHFSTTFDNLSNLPADYIDQLKSMYSPDMQQRMIYGQFGRVHKGRPVFPQFSRGNYIRPFSIDRNLPLIRGWDFGFNNPACTWMQLAGHQLRVVGSILGSRIYLDDFVREKVIPYETELVGGKWIGSRMEFCDPAGSQESDKGLTSVQILNELQIYPAHRRTKIEEGLKAIKSFLDGATNGDTNFLIHPRATRLIEGFRGGYSRLDGEDLPDKTSGFDHEMDALRYAAVHLFNRRRVNELNLAQAGNQVWVSKTGSRRFEI